MYQNGKAKQLGKKIVIKLINFYRYWLSLLLGNCCRFTPSCSEYAILAIEKYGVSKGLWLAGKRILKCHPWHPGGEDWL